MNGKLRNMGLAALSVSLIMLALGSVPQAYSQAVTSTMTIDISCGIAVAGAATFPGTVGIGASVANTDVDLNNNGSGEAAIDANAGARSDVANAAAGGYRGVVDEITHIDPISITLQIDNQGQVTMTTLGTDVSIGTLVTADVGQLEVGVTANIVNAGFTDPDLEADFTLTVTACTLI